MKQLNYDRTFFAISDGIKEEFQKFIADGSRYDFLVDMRMLPWEELESGKNEQGRWVLGKVPGGGQVRIQLNSEYAISEVSEWIEGPEAWARQRWKRAAPSGAQSKKVDRAAKNGIELDTALSRLDNFRLWGSEVQQGRQLHYVVLHPPCLLVVTTDDSGHIQEHQLHDRQTGAKLMRDAIERSLSD